MLSVFPWAFFFYSVSKIDTFKLAYERLPCFAFIFEEVAPGFSGGQVLFIHSPTGLAIFQGPAAAFSTLLLQETSTRRQHFFRPN